ncbi:hypothetical protein ACIBG8_47645 [Nonomuraea sp. NPDC050556]|uniref:hypothetical protein n=1 Tax=Nonomuraea sp. NPDC050556 TaxID=3364369 RepID=UPI0037AEC085
MAWGLLGLWLAVSPLRRVVRSLCRAWMGWAWDPPGLRSVARVLCRVLVARVLCRVLVA